MNARQLAGTVATAYAVATSSSDAARANQVPSHVDVRADRVAFYPYQNQTLLAGDGHVVVTAGARTIQANAVRYDVVGNALLFTGDVRVADRGRTLQGEAYAVNLSTGAGELLRVADVPATFAVRDDDPATAVEGPLPKDAFATPDLDGVRPYIRSRHAIVTPGAGVRMSPADFPTGAGPAVRLPTFYYTIVANQNILQTSLPGATFDQPFNLGGSPGSLLAAHVRYDSYYGPSFGIDERLVNRDKSYAVVSLIPFNDRRIDVLGFEQIRHGLQQTFYGTHTIGANPFNSLTYRLQNTGAMTTQTLQTDVNNYNNDVSLTVATLTHEIPHFIGYQVAAGYGYDHNFFGYPVANDFRTTLSGFAYAPTLTVKGTSFDERYNYAYTSYDYPHQFTDGTFTFSVGRRFGRIGLFGSAAFEQIDNRFRDPAIAAHALNLPDPGQPYFAPDGTPYPGYFAYAGLSTLRTYAAVATFAGRGDNRTQLSLTHTADFPQFHGLGRPPLTLTLDVTRRVAAQLRIEIARSYTFGWSGRYLSPQYSLSISP